MLYEYTNKEMDIAAACFRIGNYYSLRDMPDDFTANNVNQAMRERLEKAQIISAINAQNRKIYASLGGGGGVFQKFDWMPDEFSLRKSVNVRPPKHYSWWVKEESDIWKTDEANEYARRCPF